MNGFPKEFTDDYSKKIAAPNQVFTRSAYKNFISTFTVQNDEKVKGFKGLKILKEVKRKLESTMQEHGQIKYYAVARLLMKKKLDDKVLERTDDFYVAGQKHELQRTDQITMMWVFEWISFEFCFKWFFLSGSPASAPETTFSFLLGNNKVRLAWKVHEPTDTNKTYDSAPTLD
jgi:hypothetical protein